MFYILFLLTKWAIRSFPLFGEQGHSLKMNDVSESLRSLIKNEQIACFFVRIAHSLIFSQKRKNERFAQKTNEWISNPALGLGRLSWGPWGNLQ